MVEINGKRKAFLDMLAWSEELITDVRKPEIMVMTSLWASSYLLITPITLASFVTLNPTQINRRQTLPASFTLVGCLPQSSLAWKTLRKVRTLALQQIKERGALYLWLIVVISVRQSTIAAISGLHCPGAGYGQFEHKADSLIAKFKEAGGTVREIDVSKSPRLSPLWLSASSCCLCHGLLIITVITPYKAQRDKKCQRTVRAGEQQLLTCRCVSVMLLRSMQNTRRS